MIQNRFPALFVSDFGPMPAFEEDAYTACLEKTGKSLPRPRAIVVMSGHWETSGAVAVTASAKPGIIYDYSGFPEEFYRVTYPCPGDLVLAQEIATLLSAAKIPARPDSKRALDHGAWVPLYRLYPKADIPVIEISSPGSAHGVFEIGKALAPLRERGILLVGAGALSHNLRLAFQHQKNDPPDKWAVEFDHWIADKLDHGKTEDLLNYHTLAPSAALAAPTEEHFNPLFFTLGAALGEPVHHLYREIRYGNGIMRVFSAGN